MWQLILKKELCVLHIVFGFKWAVLRKTVFEIVFPEVTEKSYLL